MTTCVFRYCKNTSRNINESSCVSFHRFVHPGHPKREKWIQILQRDRSEDTWLPTKYSFVCSAHFHAGDMYTTKAGKRFLKKSAVPCINPSEYADKNPHASPTSIDEMQISDSDSIFDSPKEIQLKKDLRKAADAKKALTKKVIRLQRQNKYLKNKNETLTAIVKKFNEKFRMNKQIENKMVKKIEGEYGARKLILKKRGKLKKNYMWYHLV